MILRFLQRWAVFFAVLSGLLGYRLILGDDPSWWLKLVVGGPIMLLVYLLLRNPLHTR